MNTIKSLVDNVSKLSNCKIHPSCGLPRIEECHLIPDDIFEFYEICGGIDLFLDAEFSISIVCPDRFQLANPVIIGEKVEDDISSSWYIIAFDNSDYLTIDLNKERLERCYDSFWDSHGLIGECPIIAMSFTDLLTRLIINKGQRWYWLQDDFETLGDAYD